MGYRVALSYAGEDACFVEYVAAILERYLGDKSVFYYTSAGARANIRTFFEFINDCLSDNPRHHPDDVFRTVCFVHQIDGNNRIVVGQHTELHDDHEMPHNPAPAALRTWQGITNSRRAANLQIRTIGVVLPDHGMSEEQREDWAIPFDLNCFGQATMLCEPVSDMDKASAEEVAETVLRDVLGLKPATHSCKAFTYEKDTISFYTDLLRTLRRTPFSEIDDSKRKELTEYFNAGVPLVWPSVRLRTDLNLRDNLLLRDGTIGSARPGMTTLLPGHQLFGQKEPERVVVSAALSQYHDCSALNSNPDACMIRSHLTFPEAGPRAKIMQRPPAVGIVVSGGIAPGINAVIDGIVSRHESYNAAGVIFGYRHGLHALSQVPIVAQNSRILLCSGTQAPNAVNTAEHVSQGGSILGTFRLERLDDPLGKDNLDRVLINIEGLDVLYIIGGDGSMKAANLLSKEARSRGIPVSIVGIPKTMDNDILWVWQTFGFATAVEKAREIINSLSTEVRANPRICVLQLFGSVSGFVVSHAVLASQSDQCDAALIPEGRFTIKALADKLLRRFRDDSGSIDEKQLPWGMVVMAETAIPEDAKKYASEAGLDGDEIGALDNYKSEDKYFDGQTTDPLRAAGLKLVMRGLEKELKQYFDYVKIFANEPRHILRATDPSFSDIITGQRLGALAVDNAMAGYASFIPDPRIRGRFRSADVFSVIQRWAI